MEKSKSLILGEYILKKRKERFGKQAAFADALDRDPGTVSKLENGKLGIQITAPFLKEIAQVLEIDYLILYQMMGYIDSDVIRKTCPSFSTEIITFPIYGKVSAGLGYLNFESEGKELRILNKYNLNENTFAMSVNGDSMEPEILEDSYVLVDPSQCEYENLNNKIVVSKYNDEIYVKKVMTYDDLVILRSINPDYEDIIIQGDNFDNLECIGKVVRVLYEKDYH